MDAAFLPIIAILVGIIFWLLIHQSKHSTMPAYLPQMTNEETSSYRKRFAGLQMRMTFSYVWITIASLLSLLIIINSISSLRNRPDTVVGDSAVVATIAHQYATEVALQAQGKAPGSVFPYPLGEKLQNGDPDYYTDSDASTLLRNNYAVPYLVRLYPDNPPVSFALLIAPDLRILSSSYPLRYSPGENVANLMAQHIALFQGALHGIAQQGTFEQSGNTLLYATATVWSRTSQSVAAIYVQVPLATLHTDWPGPNLLSYVTSSLSLTFLLLLLLAPLGGIFGFISTRSMVKRLKNLAIAARLVANGYYRHRLPVESQDEVGQLEQQFNRMAEQLDTSMKRQKELAEQNARLAERSRISRELHDAISQDLFSLSLLAGGLQKALPADAPLQHQASALEQTASNMIREMRALLLELRPTKLEQLTLRDALEELAQAYSTRLGMNVRAQLTTRSLEPRLEHTLLRIAQEALSNAARHANASEISLNLLEEQTDIVLRIQDNGQGIKNNAESLRHGLGLRLMQERVQEMHGTLSLTSTPGQGTWLEVRLPLREEQI